MIDNLLGIVAVIACVMLLMLPVVAIFMFLSIIIFLVYRGFKTMNYRYGYVCYEEKGVKRDTGLEPVNETVYDTICEMCMKNGFKVLVSFSDRDPSRVQKAIDDTRTIYKSNGTAIDNHKKVF